MTAFNSKTQILKINIKTAWSIQVVSTMVTQLLTTLKKYLIFIKTKCHNNNNSPQSLLATLIHTKLSQSSNICFKTNIK